MRIGSEDGSHFRLIHLCITLGLGVMERNKDGEQRGDLRVQLLIQGFAFRAGGYFTAHRDRSCLKAKVEPPLTLARVDFGWGGYRNVDRLDRAPPPVLGV